MKKKIMTLLCICTLGLGMTVSVSAANSPSAEPITDKKPTTAPETGEMNVAALSFGGLALLGGVAVVSRKKMAE